MLTTVNVVQSAMTAVSSPPTRKLWMKASRVRNPMSLPSSPSSPSSSSLLLLPSPFTLSHRRGCASRRRWRRSASIALTDANVPPAETAFDHSVSAATATCSFVH